MGPPCLCGQRHAADAPMCRIGIRGACCESVDNQQTREYGTQNEHCSRLPEDSNHSSAPIVIDSKTFLINTAGWKPKASLGIYRSDDNGQSWKHVSDFGPAGQALITHDGAIYWQRIWGGGLLKSADQGKT
jgi:hypothetical protein